MLSHSNKGSLAAAGRERARCRVLVAHTDAALLDSYQQFLSHAGFEVARATTALDCLTHLHNFQPDVLVVEVDQPWSWGEAIVNMMEEGALLRRMPVIALTEKCEAVHLRGVPSWTVSSSYIQPVAPAVLAQTIRRLLPVPG